MQSAESALLLAGEEQMYVINPSKNGGKKRTVFLSLSHLLTRQRLSASQLCEPKGTSRQQLVASVPALVTSDVPQDKPWEGMAPTHQMRAQLEGGLPPLLSAKGSMDRAQSLVFFGCFSPEEGSPVSALCSFRLSLHLSYVKERQFVPAGYCILILFKWSESPTCWDCCVLSDKPLIS